MLLRNIREEKRRLRARCKKQRAACPPDVKQRLDEALTERVLALDEYKSCRTLFVFVSTPIECDTHCLINRAFADGKRVAVPRCSNKSGEMEFYYISSLDDLRPGMFSLSEPDPEICERATGGAGDLCIVPGLCFDCEGYRVGFGKGYYDRFLEGFTGVTAGICYRKFVFRELPRGANDKPTDILVTDKYSNRMVDKRCMND